jgi:hypothetical protein
VAADREPTAAYGRIQHVAYAISAFGVAGHSLLEATKYPGRRKRLLRHIDDWLNIGRQELSQARAVSSPAPTEADLVAALRWYASNSGAGDGYAADVIARYDAERAR